MRRRLRGTKVVLRSGSPVLTHDLLKVSAQTARATLVLAEPGDADTADATTLRTVLALQTLPRLRGHVVAEMRDIDNEPLVKIVGGENIETVTSHDVLGRLMLMSAREPGLASVYACVLGFDGDEFYAKRWPLLNGVDFGELQPRFPAAVPIGIRSADGRLELNPPASRALRFGDELVVLAEDNDSYGPEAPVFVRFTPPPDRPQAQARRETILCCGWRRDIRDILIQLDRQLAPGSELHMLNDVLPLEERNVFLKAQGLDVVKDLINVRLKHFMGNTAMRKSLEALPIAQYDSCMILADQSHEAEMMHSDSHVIATLLQLREIQKEVAQKTAAPMSVRRPVTRETLQLQTPIICEVLDPRTQHTIEKNRTVANTSDFIQSNKLIAQILAMCAEDRSIQALLAELLGPGGVSFSVQPVDRYARTGERLTFLELASRVRAAGGTLCGYQDAAETTINPRQKHSPVCWDTFDVIVLSGKSSQPTPAQMRPGRHTRVGRGSVVHVAKRTSKAALALARRGSAFSVPSAGKEEGAALAPSSRKYTPAAIYPSDAKNHAPTHVAPRGAARSDAAYAHPV